MPSGIKHNVDVSGSVEPQPSTGQSIMVLRPIATINSSNVGFRACISAIDPTPRNAIAGATRRVA